MASAPKHWRYNNNKTQICSQSVHGPARSRALAGRVSTEPGGWTPTCQPTFVSAALTALLSSGRIYPAICLKFLVGWEFKTEICHTLHLLLPPCSFSQVLRPKGQASAGVPLLVPPCTQMASPVSSVSSMYPSWDCFLTHACFYIPFPSQLLKCFQLPNPPNSQRDPLKT